MDTLFTEPAWSALERAARHAGTRRQRAIEPRHILLGLLEAEPSGAQVVLRRMGASPPELAEALHDSLPRPQDGSSEAKPSELPYTSRAEEILDRARSTPRNPGHRRVGTADLLLAVSAEKGIARTILRQFSVSEEGVRSAMSACADGLAAEDRGEEPALVDPPHPPRSDAAASRPASPTLRRPPSDAPILRKPQQTPRPTGDPEPAAPAASQSAEAAPAPAPARPKQPDPSPAPRSAPATPTRRPTSPSTRPPPSSPSSVGSELAFLSPDPSAALPLYRQIADAIEAAVATGRLSPGTRLGSIRDTAERLAVSPGTVARAYRTLEERGVLASQGTRGTFVAARDASRSRSERVAELTKRLRPVAVAAYRIGAHGDEVRAALDEALRGILTEG